MKKYLFPIFTLLALVALIGVSCKSAPPPSEEAPPVEVSTVEEVPQVEEVPPEVDTDALEASMNRAEETRKQAIDFESPSYFPSEWETIEDQYNAIGELLKPTESEVQEAVTSLNSAADAYYELFMKTLPLYAQAREDEITAARDELVSTGFTRILPEYLRIADEMALTALAQFEAKEYYTARDTAAAALSEYETLLLGARIHLARQEIVDRGFIEFDQENFEKADEVTQTAMKRYEAGNKEGAISSAEEALLRYNVVLTNGWIAYAASQRASAIAERELALLNKVNIAVRDIFREADTIFNEAEENFISERFDNAAILFTEAEIFFAIAGQETETRRQRAMETIRLAEEKIEESIETAAEAEIIIEGVSR